MMMHNVGGKVGARIQEFGHLVVLGTTRKAPVSLPAAILPVCARHRHPSTALVATTALESSICSRHRLSVAFGADPRSPHLSNLWVDRPTIRRGGNVFPSGSRSQGILFKIIKRPDWRISDHLYSTSNKGSRRWKSSTGKHTHEDTSNHGSVAPTSGATSSAKETSSGKDADRYFGTNKHLLDRLPHMPHMPTMSHIHRPSREELLAAATGFWSRQKVRFKWFSIRSLRPFNMDDISAFFSWFLVGHVILIVVGTTTFFSLTIFLLNTVFAQGRTPCFTCICADANQSYRNIGEMDRQLPHKVVRHQDRL